MVPRHMKNQIIKKQAHCLQAIGKVILGLPWQGHRSYITVLDSCAVKCIRPHFQEPERLEDEMEFTGLHHAGPSCSKLG